VLTNRPACFAILQPFLRSWNDLFPQLYEEAVTRPQLGEQTLVTPPWDLIAALRGRLEALMADYVIYRRRTGPLSGGDPLQDFYYAWQRLCDVLALGWRRIFLYLPAHAR
jgi:hypothetical protein